MPMPFSTSVLPWTVLPCTLPAKLWSASASPMAASWLSSRRSPVTVFLEEPGLSRTP